MPALVRDSARRTLFALRRWGLSAAVVSAALAGTPAAADVIYTFEQTAALSRGAGPYPAGPLPATTLTASGSITLSDQAFAQGLNVSAGWPNGPSPVPDWATLGILDLRFAVNYSSPSQSLLVTLADLAVPPAPNYPRNWQFAFQADLDDPTPTGRIRFANWWSSFDFNLSGTDASGSFSTDYGGVCGYTGNCTFTGTFSIVPEPGSLLLFGSMVAGLALTGAHLRRRARARPAA